jgi:hypothetical protein
MLDSLRCCRLTESARAVGADQLVLPPDLAVGDKGGGRGRAVEPGVGQERCQGVRCGVRSIRLVNDDGHVLWKNRRVGGVSRCVCAGP